MPTYKNSTSVVISVEGVRIEPGQSVETKQVLSSPLPAGITKTFDSPVFSPTLYSNSFAGDSGTTGPISVPANAGAQYKITVYCSAGGIKFWTNKATGGGFEVLLAGEGKAYQLLGRMVDNFSVEYLLAGSKAEVSIA
jgi:hypothetical protein